MIEIGKKYGHWTVLMQNKDYYFLCRCDCGKVKNVFGGNLNSGKTISCGCRNGINKDVIYNRLKHIYNGMRARCYYINKNNYNHYGGRGIRVCDEWKNDFLSFYKWSIDNGYRDDLTIDRIDVDGDYTPDNCRWVDTIVQANNKRNNVIINYKNKKYTVAEFARLIGCNDGTLRGRLKRGWTVDKCVEYAKKDARYTKLEYKGKYYTLKNICDICKLDRRFVWDYLIKQNKSIYDIMEEFGHE